MKSPVIKQQSQAKMDFFKALEKVAGGESVTRLEWEDKSSYCFLQEDYLTISIKGRVHTWVVRKVDMQGTDWVVVDKSLN